jgi:hypothetical protein
MTLESQIEEIISGLSPDEVIPVLATYLAGVGFWGNIDPEKLTAFVGRIIRDTYKINTAPPLEERN